MRQLAGAGGIEQGVVEPVQLELEEQQVGGGGRHLVLRVAVELGVGGVGGVAGIHQAGVAHDAAEPVVDRLVAPHRLEQAAVARERFEAALVLAGESLALCRNASEVAGL